MTNSKTRALRDLLQEFRVTGDETLILELFQAQEQSVKPRVDTADSLPEAVSAELNTEDTMVFSEIYSPIDTEYLSLTSPTFDEQDPPNIHDPHFLSHSDYIQTEFLAQGGWEPYCKYKTHN